MEYDILTTSSAATLANLVSAYIRKGWKPQGGVSVMYNAGGYTWAQSMVKEAA